MKEESTSEAFGNIKAKPDKYLKGEMLDIIHGTSVNEFEEIICNHFLGKDYYIDSPVGGDVGRSIILYEILSRNPRPRDSYKEKIFDKIKNLIDNKDNTIDKYLKDLYKAILTHEGFSQVFFSSKNFVKDCYCTRQPECLKVESNNMIVISAPLSTKNYYKSSKLSNIGKSRITDTFWIDKVYIYDNKEVNSLHIKCLIEMLNSLRWKKSSN